MSSVKNQKKKTIGLILLITVLCEWFVLNLYSELGERISMLWMVIIIPTIIIAIIGAIAYLVKDASVNQSFLKKVFKTWLILHIIWSIFSICVYNSLSSIGWT